MIDAAVQLMSKLCAGERISALSSSEYSVYSLRNGETAMGSVLRAINMQMMSTGKKNPHGSIPYSSTSIHEWKFIDETLSIISSASRLTNPWMPFPVSISAHSESSSVLITRTSVPGSSWVCVSNETPSSASTSEMEEETTSVE